MVFCGFRLFTRLLSQLLRDWCLGSTWVVYVSLRALKKQEMGMRNLASGPNPVSNLSGSTTGNDKGSSCQASWLKTALPTPFCIQTVHYSLWRGGSGGVSSPSQDRLWYVSAFLAQVMTTRGLLAGPWAEVSPRCIYRGLLLEEKVALRTSPLWLSTQCSKSSLSVINRCCNFKQKSTNGISSALWQKDIEWNNFIGGWTVALLSWIVSFSFYLALRSMKCQKPFVWVFPLWWDNSTCANISETCLVPFMASCLCCYSKHCHFHCGLLS